MHAKNRKLDLLMNLDFLFAMISLIILIAVTFFGVIMRYFFNNPFVWQEEIQLWCFVWVTFFGASAVCRNGGHVSIDILIDLLPPNAKKYATVFEYAIVSVILFLTARYGSQLIVQLLQSYRTTNVLGIPYYIIYSALPIACVLIMINYTLMLIVSMCPSIQKYFVEEEAE